MKRLMLLVAAASLLGGCKGQSPPGNDPFFGRTTIPPPATGAAAGRQPDPYYRPAPNAGAPLAPVPQAQQPGVTLPPAATGSGSGGRFDPPGGTFNYRGTSTGGQGTMNSTPRVDPGRAASPLAATTPATEASPRPFLADTTPSRIRIVQSENRSSVVDDSAGASMAKADARTSDLPALAASTVDGSGGALAGRPRAVTLQARPKTSDAGWPTGGSTNAVTPTGGESRPGDAPTRSDDIMNLPPARYSSSTSQRPAADNGIRWVAGDATPDGAANNVVTAGGVER